VNVLYAQSASRTVRSTLIGQVITVSLETQRIIATFPSINFPA